MRNFDHHWIKPGVARFMRQAADRGTFTMNRGKLNSPANIGYLNSCIARHAPTGTTLTLTRDTGYHEFGWWKNPEHNQCYHLALAFNDPEEREHTPIVHRHDLATEWLEAFFPDHIGLLWTEPPRGDEAIRTDCWHYRLFYQPSWFTPVTDPQQPPTACFNLRGWFSWQERLDAIAALSAPALAPAPDETLHDDTDPSAPSDPS